MAARNSSVSPSPRAAKEQRQRARDRERATSLGDEARLLGEKGRTIQALIDSGAKTKRIALAELCDLYAQAAGYAWGWQTAQLRLSGDANGQGRPRKGLTGLMAAPNDPAVCSRDFLRLLRRLPRTKGPGAPVVYPAAFRAQIVRDVD